MSAVIYLLFLTLFLKWLGHIHHQPSPWINAIRLVKSLAVMVVMTGYLMLIEASALAWFITLPFVGVVGFCHSVTIRPYELTHLTLTPALKNGTYHVHLKSVLQPFTRDAYRDLALLVDLLPEYQGKTLLLTSPLLAKNGDFRGIETLSTLPASIEKRTLSYWRSPLVFLVLCYYKYLRRVPILRTADLTTQYQLRLTLRS
ncbi:hypothetical protein [Vibrio sp. 10N.261.46.A3]|uniref:hypothetical protein n=1 Tax=Vibrio sp. 10N.261.46.A3 TaxID=3229658 RepID=UPI0035523CE5